MRTDKVAATVMAAVAEPVAVVVPVIVPGGDSEAQGISGSASSTSSGSQATGSSGSSGSVNGGPDGVSQTAKLLMANLFLDPFLDKPSR